MAKKWLKKNEAAVSLGRKGGQARAARMTPEERSKAARQAARSMWKGTTPEQRSKIMTRRAKVAVKNRKAAQEAK